MFSLANWGVNREEDATHDDISDFSLFSIANQNDDDDDDEKSDEEGDSRKRKFNAISNDKEDGETYKNKKRKLETGNIYRNMLKDRKRKNKIRKEKKEKEEALKNLTDGASTAATNTATPGNTNAMTVTVEDKGQWLQAPPTPFYILETLYGPAQPECECFACMEVDESTYKTCIERTELDILNASIKKNVGSCNMVQHAISISKQYEEKIRKPTNERIAKIYGYTDDSVSDEESSPFQSTMETDPFEKYLLTESDTMQQYRKYRKVKEKPKLLPPWLPSTVYAHIMSHKSKISNDIEVFAEILKDTVIGIYKNSLTQVHTKNTSLNGTPVVKYDPTQHRMMMYTLDRWMKLKFVPPQKLKEVIKYESTAWGKDTETVDDRNKSMYGNSLFLLKESEKKP